MSVQVLMPVNNMGEVTVKIVYVPAAEQWAKFFGSPKREKWDSNWCNCKKREYFNKQLHTMDNHVLEMFKPK
jgi:hypothetical protein